MALVVRRSSFVAIAVAILHGCGGATSSESPGEAPDAGAQDGSVCASLASSGLAFAQCIAKDCCGALTTCVADEDGVSYETCVANCTYDGGTVAPDGGTCTTACESAHPRGAVACRGYLDCVLDRCAPGR